MKVALSDLFVVMESAYDSFFDDVYTIQEEAQIEADRLNKEARPGRSYVVLPLDEALSKIYRAGKIDGESPSTC